MHDILTESRISLTKLAQREGVNVCTTWRWASRGVAGIRLETYSVGHRRFTSSPGAFERWVQKVTEAKRGDAAVSRPSRRRAAERRKARNELRTGGLLDD
jgi:hypothetical protein